MPALTCLHVWSDAMPRSGPLNMAIDEALLESLVTPTLRLFRWDGPWVSIGCFVPIADAVAEFPGQPVVRRWTGGGMVDHAHDWTYSLVVPRGEPLAGMGTAASYRVIHQALAAALAACGHPVVLADAPPPGLGGQCFHSPVFADILIHGRKVAGGAQRRTRHGLLHQGSVQGLSIPDALGRRLADVLHPQAIELDPEHRRSVTARAETIATGRYATPHWQTRV